MKRNEMKWSEEFRKTKEEIFGQRIVMLEGSKGLQTTCSLALAVCEATMKEMKGFSILFCQPK